MAASGVVLEALLHWTVLREVGVDAEENGVIREALLAQTRAFFYRVRGR